MAGRAPGVRYSSSLQETVRHAEGTATRLPCRVPRRLAAGVRPAPAPKAPGARAERWSARRARLFVRIAMIALGLQQNPSGGSAVCHARNEISAASREVASSTNEEADAPESVSRPWRDERPFHRSVGLVHRLVWRCRLRLGVRETLPIGPLQGAGDGAGGVDRETVAPIVTVLCNDVAGGLAELSFSERIGFELSGAFVQC